MTLEEALYQERLQNRQLNDLIQADPPTGGADLAQRMRATQAGLQLPPPDLSGWSDTPDAGGLGLATRDPLPDPLPSPSGPSWGDSIKMLGTALEAGSAGFFGRTPLYMQQQQLDLQKQQLEGQLAMQRATRAQQMQQLEETRKKRQWDDLIKIDKEFANDPDRWEMGMTQLAKEGFTPASHLLEVGGKKMAGELESSLPFIERYYPEFAAKYAKDPKSISRSEVAMTLQGVKKLKERRAQSDANAQELAALEAGYEKYLGGDPSAMMPGDAERLIELRNEQEKKQLELEKLRLGNKKLAAEADPTKPSDMLGHDRESFTKQLFSPKYGRDVIYKNLQPEEQSAVNAKLIEYQGAIQGSKTTGTQEAQNRVPVGKTGSAQLWRDPVTGKTAASWATPDTLESIGAVNIRPDQVQTLNQLANIDSLIKELEVSGEKMLRKRGVKSSWWGEIPRGIAQTPILKLGKTFAGDPDASKVQMTVNTLSTILPRAAGDTHLSDTDKASYAQSLFNDADTVESFVAKLKVLKDVQNRVRENAGFVTSEGDVIERLMLRGLSDAQIKAAMNERKRIFK